MEQTILLRFKIIQERNNKNGFNLSAKWPKRLNIANIKRVHGETQRVEVSLPNTVLICKLQIQIVKLQLHPKLW